MSEEKIKKKEKNKITSFRAYRNELENPEMDQFLRESIMKEADELEARLNNDPKLAGISASVDMFDMIVGKLKAQGYWEEDETESDADWKHISYTTDKMMKQELADEHEVVASGYGDKLNDTLKKEIKIEIKKESEKTENKPEQKQHVTVAQMVVCTGKDEISVKKKETEKNVTAEVAEIETTVPGRPEEELAKLYREQPEEVLRLMERGRKAELEEKEQSRKKKCRNKLFRRTMVTAAVLGMLFGVGFSTEASRGWILKMWDAAMEGFGFKAKTNYVGDWVVSRPKTEVELVAIKEIEEKIDISVPNFAYLPEGMKFSGYEITNAEWESKIFYIYQEKIFNMELINLKQEGSSYYTLDNETVLVDKFRNSQDIEIELWKTNLDMEMQAYMAIFEYKGGRYILNGMISLEEIKKMLEFMIIL